MISCGRIKSLRRHMSSLEHRNNKIAVLIPCYNEEVTIHKVVSDFKRELPEADIYVYDNNSSDNTSKLAKDAGAIVRFEPRQGKGNVVRQMFRDIDADCYLMVDGDDTYPAESARELCEPILNGEADMTVGDRLSNGTYAEENKRAFHGFGNDLVRAMIKWIYGYSFDDVMTGYRAFSRPFVKTFPVMSEGFQIETEISIHAVDRRWRIKDVPIVYRDRPEGSVSKLNTIGDGMKVMIAIASLFKNYRPLKFFSLAALVLAAIGLLLGIPVIVEFFETGLVPRLPTALLATAFMFLCGLSFATGLVLDNLAKTERKQWELEVYKISESDR
ncbi:glycosyltransferase family 2 protein [Collinsella tanakaei]|uniref:glycosyltransferase family 2 protein n=3 Tax=Collinsella tanakaei TaxID=626935 RepID=UPI002F93CEE1